MTHISLIIATMGRVAELHDLFDSLVAQNYPALDVILVDQNGDDRLAPVVAAYAQRLTLRHIRSPRPHANAARNLGLRASDPDFENRVAEQLAAIVRRQGRKVSLVGWSLGATTAIVVAGRTSPTSLSGVSRL